MVTGHITTARPEPFRSWATIPALLSAIGAAGGPTFRFLMKLATLHDGSRDGQLVVVSRDLASAQYATGIANRLQLALDDWGFVAPQLQDLYDALNAGRARHPFPFDPQQCMAPLPRAFQCVELAASRDTTSALAPAPMLQQLAGAALAGACAPLPARAVGMELDFGAGLAVVTGDLAVASTSGQALDAVRLLMLANSVALRALEPAEREIGMGAQHSRPVTAFSPVAVTLDELGIAWSGGRLALTVQSALNGRQLGRCDAAAGMAWSFGELVAHAARTRTLGAGSIVCSGPLRAAPVPGGKQATDSPSACASLLERRHWEAQQGGQTRTEFLQLGDQIRLDMKGPDGRSLCGAIEQTVADRPRVQPA